MTKVSQLDTIRHAVSHKKLMTVEVKPECVQMCESLRLLLSSTNHKIFDATITSHSLDDTFHP